MSSPMQNQHPPPAILIVEDEGIVAMDLQQTLLELGYEAPAIAGSAEEALARAAERRPDLVLMDIRIQGGTDGIEVAAALTRKYGMPVVFLTAHADTKTLERAKKVAPYGYLVKPVTPAEARSCIEIALYRHQLEQARERAAELETQRRVLEESGRAKDNFLANMSHELRTPLNGVLGFAKLMHDGMAGPVSEEHRRFLGHVLDSGRRFLQVINDVLELARLESKRVELKPARLELGPLVEEIVGQLRPAIDERHQRLSVMLDPACSSVVNDAAMLQQVLYSFLSNAPKFTPAGGAISILIAPDTAGTFRLEVRDTGIGVHPEDLKRLFIAFEQLDAGMAKRYEGAGLGLALAKRIAENQGGRVGVDSAPGRGSAFFAILPRTLTAPG